MATATTKLLAFGDEVTCVEIGADVCRIETTHKVSQHAGVEKYPSFRRRTSAASMAPSRGSAVRVVWHQQIPVGRYHGYGQTGCFEALHRVWEGRAAVVGVHGVVRAHGQIVAIHAQLECYLDELVDALLLQHLRKHHELHSLPPLLSALNQWYTQ